MAGLKKAMKEWLRKRGIDMEDWEKKEKPVLEMRKKQGGGFWQADIGMDDDEETEEERRKRKLREGGH